MSRARGRKNPTRPGGFTDPGPDSPEGREIGESKLQDPAGSPIPGLTGNIVNYQTVRQTVPVPEPRQDPRGDMTHGVPPELDTTEERASAERGDGAGKGRKVPLEPIRPKPIPIPVFVVEEQGGPGTFLTAYPRQVTVPANTGADPARLCGRDPRRNRIGLLNEDTATNVRFAQGPAALTNGGGALLPWPTNTYVWLETQDELYAVTVSSTLSVIVSVIEEFGQEL